MLIKQLTTLFTLCVLFAAMSLGQVSRDGSVLQPCDPNDDDTYDTGWCGGATFIPGDTVVQLPTPPCYFTISAVGPKEACPGANLTFSAGVVSQAFGTGIYTYQWSVPVGSNLQINGPSTNPTVNVTVTGANNANDLDLSITRTDCALDGGAQLSNDTTLNIDSFHPVPSLSIDLGTCGGFPSTHPHWQVQLSATPSNGITTAWSGNVNFLQTNDFNATFEPLGPGSFDVSANATYLCGSVSTTRTFNTNDCESQILFRQGMENQGPEMNAQQVVQGEVVRLKNPYAGEYDLRVLNTMGQVLMQQRVTGDVKLHIQSLRPGLYFVRIGEGNELRSITSLMVK